MNENAVAPSELDPLVLSLGQLIGIIEVDNGSVTFQEDWFSDPLGVTEASIKANPDELIQTITLLMGEVGGNALGVPVTDPALLGTWYPLNIGGTVTGLYLVSYPSPAHEGAQVIGVGTLVRWTFPSTDNGSVAQVEQLAQVEQGALVQQDNVGPDAILVQVWGLAPVVELGNDALNLAVGQQGFPFVVGASAEGADGQKLFEGVDISLEGIKVSASLDLGAANPVDLSLVFLELLLPWATEAQDISLVDLAALSNDEILSTIASIALSALAQLGIDTDKLDNVLPALGLAATVPGVSGVVPPLGWVEMAQAAAMGEDPAAPLLMWFTALMDDASAGQAWLTAMGNLLGTTPPEVTGSGTRADPFSVALASVSSVGTFSFTMGTATTAAGVRQLFPGVIFGGDPLSLGGSGTYVLEMSGALELGEVDLTDSGSISAQPDSLNGSAGFTFRNADANQPLVNLSTPTLEVGSVRGGVTLAEGLQLQPDFQLVSVTTADGTYDTLNLLDPQQIAQVGLSALITEIVDALAELLGLTGGEGDDFGTSVGVLIGFDAPDLPQGSEWPATPPLSAEGLTSSVLAMQNPLAAITGYYQTLLTTEVGGQLAFVYLVEAFGTLLASVGAPPITVSGSGTPTDPWLVALASTGISLLIFQDTPTGDRLLTIGFQLNADVVDTPQKVVLGVEVQVVQLTISSAGVAPGAWLPLATAGLSLPEALETTSILGASIRVDSVAADVTWGSVVGWGWDMRVANPTLTVGGDALPIAETLVFSNTTQLDALMSEAGFPELLVRLVGLFAARTQLPAALAVDGVLGLLPDLGPYLPAGLDWPQDMPVLTPPNFLDPVAQIQAQLSAITRDPDNLTAAATLVAWAIQNGGDVPTLGGSGTVADPLRVPLGFASGFDMRIWSGSGDSLGVGLGRRGASDPVSGVHVVTDVQLLAVEIPLGGSGGTSAVPVPSLTLGVTVTDTAGTITTYQDDDVTGFAAAVQFSLDDGLVATPIVALITSGGPVPVPAPSAQQAFQAALNAAFQFTATALAADPTYQDTYTILADLGLLLSGATPGISGAGWTGLYANPVGFLTTGIVGVLSDPTSRDTLYGLLESMLGITPPEVPVEILDVLAGLGIVSTPDLGYAPKPQSLVELANEPVTTLTTMAQALLSDDVTLQALVSAIAGSTGGTFGVFTWSVANGNEIIVEVTPQDAVAVGSFALLSGAVTLDLANGTLTTLGRVYVPQVRVSVAPAVSWAFGQPPGGLTVNLEWGDGSTPQAPELTLFPYDQSTFITQLTALGPTQTVSAFVSMILDQYLLTPYPLAMSLFQGLGLVVGSGQQDTFKSLLGLFDNPVEWLLSGSVLGVDGTLDIAAVAALLNDLPAETGVDGLTLAQLGSTTGVQVVGLPYDVELKFTVDDTQTTFAASLSITQTVAGEVAQVTLTSGVTLDRSFQPGVLGDVKVQQTSTEAWVDAGYDKGFTLSVGQTGGVTLALLPFGGWQTLVQAVASLAIQLLIQQLTSQIITGLQGTDAEDFVNRLQAAGDALDVDSLVTALSTSTTPQEILDEALNWLGDRLSEANAPDSAQAVVTLLTGYIPGTISADVGLVRWAPSGSVPLTLLSGRNTSGLLGFWVDVDFPQAGLLDVTVTTTGVGVDPADSYAVQFSFGLDALVPVVIQGSGPALIATVSGSPPTFTLLFDPQREDGVASPLQVELLPDFFQGTDIGDWVADILLWVVPRYASLILFNQTQVRAWLDTGIVDQEGAPTPAGLLEGGGLIEEDSGNYVLKSYTDLLQLTPEDFVGGFLKALMANTLKLLSIGDGGGIYLENSPALGYGARVQVPDIQVEVLPYVTFQLGATDDVWIERSGGPTGLSPGMAVYVPIPDTAPEFENTSLVLANVGVDIHGKQQAPLVMVSRFSLGEVSPRGLLDLKFSDPGSASVGGAIGFKNMGFALSPDSLSAGADINPVAANLMGSGAEGSSGNPPTDPTFSAIASYSDTFWAGLIDSSGQVTDAVIIPIQQSFGPLNVQQITVGWPDPNPDLELTVGFTGGLTLSVLSITVFNLSVGVEVDAPLDLSSYDLDLQGLAISFSAGSVQIAGGLYKEGSGAEVIYNGAMNVSVGRFSISAVGSYGVVDGSPSFFVFAATGFPIGGPPAFFIKGLAGGFAYNRSILLPKPDEVQDYILVEAALDPAAIFGSSDPTPTEALEKLSAVVAPEVGQYWIAAGVHWTTYSLIDALGLVVIEFGNELAFSLIGLGTLSLPPLVTDPSKALVFVQLGIVVTVNITEGFLSAQAQLTPNSFVLDQACKLTGGFALMIWWPPNEHSGDFVLTFGGYHPDYDPPDYYPVVPRLGMSWPVDSPVGSVSILGEAYFALTPNAIMAGGKLDLEFEAGPLSAWFKASADFIISWKPFYYDISISISVGAAFTTKLFGATVTLKASIGADLELWGPPTAGLVTVNWYVISFTIPIGDQDKDLDDKPIGTWALFAENFLPPNSDTSGGTDALVAEEDAGTQEVLKLQIPTGLIQGQTDATTWTMQRIGFELRADSNVPIGEAVAGDLTPITSTTSLGVRPMDVSALSTTVTFALSTTAGDYPIQSTVFDSAGYNDNAPMGLWATQPLVNTVAPATDTVIPNTMVGASISGVRYDDTGQLGPADLSVFDTEQAGDMVLPLSLASPYTPAAPLPQDTPIQTVMDTVMADGVVQTRNAILEALQDRSLVAPTNPDLSVMAAQATDIFQAPPVLARLSETLAPAPGGAQSLTRYARATEEEAPPPPMAAPQPQGSARRYAGQAVAATAARLACRRVRGSWSARGAEEPVLRRGGVTAWALDRRATHALTHQGPLLARVVGFDERLEPAFTAHIEGGRLTLPQGLEQAVVCGVASARPDVAGWQRGGTLVRVNARYLLGDDCLVKPQAVLRHRKLGPQDVLGVDHMLDLNQVEGADGRRAGWVTTWLPGHLTRAWILADGPVDCAVVALDPRGRAVRVAQTPIDRVALGEGTAWVLDLAGADLDGHARVMARPRGGGTLIGVVGFSPCEEAPALGEDAFDARLRDHARVRLDLGAA